FGETNVCFGTKQTSKMRPLMSAFGGNSGHWDVYFTPKRTLELSHGMSALCDLRRAEHRRLDGTYLRPPVDDAEERTIAKSLGISQVVAGSASQSWHSLNAALTMREPASA